MTEAWTLFTTGVDGIFGFFSGLHNSALDPKSELCEKHCRIKCHETHNDSLANRVPLVKVLFPDHLANAS
jgi:hypothetical protein